MCDSQSRLDVLLYMVWMCLFHRLTAMRVTQSELRRQQRGIQCFEGALPGWRSSLSGNSQTLIQMFSHQVNVYNVVPHTHSQAIALQTQTMQKIVG